MCTTSYENLHKHKCKNSYVFLSEQRKVMSSQNYIHTQVLIVFDIVVFLSLLSDEPATIFLVISLEMIDNDSWTTLN